MFATDRNLYTVFARGRLLAIEKAIKASERLHLGEVRFVVEAALDAPNLYRGQTAKERAIELFSELRIGDTQHNNGLLIYLLLADRAVEIVADCGLHARVGSHEWRSICNAMESAFRQSMYEPGVISGVPEVTHFLLQHFPASGSNVNELPDRALVL